MSDTFPRPRAMHAAPFSSRAYAGFSRAQARFISLVVPDKRGLSIVDPMCGQALLAATWAHEGAKVLVSDINPGPLALAALRSPSMIEQRQGLGAQLRDVIKRLSRDAKTKQLVSEALAQGVTESTDWLPETTKNQLRRFGLRLGLQHQGDLRVAFARNDQLQRFAIGICALAARRLSTFRLSDNVTWLRPGGLARPEAVADHLMVSLGEWEQWARQVEIGRPRGSLRTRLVSVTELTVRGGANLVITSPPYANRLDYQRMWAPETAVVQAVVGCIMNGADQFIGTNTPRQPTSQDIAHLPRNIRVALQSIKAHSAWASASYYYPFFATYALDLDRACRAMAGMLRTGGKAILFGRDTVRKDTLFPTIEIVSHAMRAGGCTVIRKEGAIIRSHIGNMRVSTDVGLFGKAQREWWLVLEKQ